MRISDWRSDVCSSDRRVHRLASGQTLGIKPAIMGVFCSLEASAIAVGRRVSDGLRRAVDRLLPTIRDMEITKPAHGLAGILPSMGFSFASETRAPTSGRAND